MRLQLAVSLLFASFVASQQIWDIWQTTWNRGRLFSSLSPSSPINFVDGGGSGSASINIADGTVYQQMAGFGGTLSDSGAQVLNNLKSTNSNNYWALLRYLFDTTEGANAAGLSYLRVTLAASDFSPRGAYSFDDTNGDTSFNNFNINNAPSNLFSVLTDIKSINGAIKIHAVPWSPPAWMKSSGSMNGGSLKSQYVTNYATYLLKCIQGFNSKGFSLYAISIQNEPQNDNPTYPTSTLTPATEAQIGIALRSLMDNNGFGGVKLIGYEHNWDNAASYPVQLMQNAPNAFAGVAFHCYAGAVGNQDSFHSAYSNKEIYFTECSGTIGSDWWSDIKWYMDNIFIGSVQHSSMSGLMWNIALDGNGNPLYPGTNSCGGGCRPIATVNSDGSYSVNQEFYAMAQASKAIIPRDAGGPTGRRIGVTVGGDLSWALRVTAFVTGRSNSADWSRYSIVVLNWDDQPNGSWNPTDVTATINFRGRTATYTFPVGITTLWWYAETTNFNGTAVTMDTLVGGIGEGQKHKQKHFSWHGLFNKVLHRSSHI
ncbi:glycoside hydrolase family 30 protein [Cylindrobasidium torrendii FP15055 ss-10]|uniref:Glycoside hydrolase family 30 protein n=1 Tax=Cylindrobasidium torrendii FP15055 ss-10 TaxID=1314674 RepID=A0A0D7BQL6_9AGAR|nr:glycoside hydrolase family 30 protein [Cylindrobasidium torrendii FP15055 ss-10]